MPKRLRILLVAILALLALAALWHLGKPLPEPTPPALRHSFSKALDSAHNGKPGAARLLYQQLARTDLSAVRRARLYAELPNYPSPQALKLASADLQGDEALVRHAAIDAVVGLVPDAQRSLLLGPLLEDDDQDIRLHTARVLLNLSPDELGLYFAPLEKVLDEYVQLLQDQTEDASAQLQLADIYLHDADYTLAAQALDRALKLAPEDPDAVATQVQVMEKQGNAEQARKLLADQLNRHPQSAQLQQELGVWLLAHDQDEYALLALARAVELAPENSDYRLLLAKTLHDLEQVEAAQRQLDEILRREPANRRARVLLIDYWKETGQLQNVQVLLAELEQQNPDDPVLQQGL